MFRVSALLAFIQALLGCAALAQPLPSDPSLVDGVLDNGLRYVIKQHAVPPGRVNINLYISSGSLNETDEQQGIAHFLEHMAFNGSERFEPGSLVPFFESLGLTFGRHQNAMTGFADTTYMVELPKADEDTIEKGMRFLSDVAFGLSLLPEEIEKEREIILEEKRSRLGPMDRVSRKVLSEIAPGSMLGARIPIGVEETILGMDQQDFRDYYSRWYTPANMTLLVVGDADPSAVLEVVKREFSRGEPGQRPVDQPVGVETTEGVRAIVAADAELSRIELSINRVGPPRGGIVDEGDYRRALVEAVGTQAFNYRLRDKVSERTVSFLSGGASSNDVFNTLRWTSVTASGETEKWREVLTDLGRELNRARTHGFSEREVERVKDSFIASAEDEVRAQKTVGAGALMGSYRASVSSDEPIMSAQQILDLDRKLLPEITRDEINSTFAEVFTFDDAVFIAQTPTGEHQPSDDELIEAGVAALVLEAPAEVDFEAVESLVEDPPTPGKVVDSTRHEATGVTSAWLSNGVRYHYLFNDYKDDEVNVTITLAGGTIQEDASNHGITQAAGLALRSPATRSLSSKQINDFFSDKVVGVRGGVSDDALSVQISGTPEELHIGFELAYLLLTEPVVEAPQLENYKERMVQLIESNDVLPQGRFARLFIETLYPEGEVRPQPLTAEEVGDMNAESAQAWLEEIIAGAPMEVAVVGDIDETRATELVTTWIGSLPARNRISTDTLREARTLPPPTGPRTGRAEVVTQTSQAYVMAGFPACDEHEVDDVRALNLAARILSTRMFKALREEEQLVYSIQTSITPASAYPGYGLMYAWSQTDPGKVDKLSDRIMEMFAVFAADGPTGEEMEVAQKKVQTDLDVQRLEPGFWRGVLSDLEYRGGSLDDYVADKQAFADMTGDQVREVFARWFAEPGHLRVSVSGSNPVAAPAEGGDAAQPQPAPSDR